MTAKRVALVTGANKGIGHEIARQLGQLDHIVWLGCRDEGRGRQAEKELHESGIDARFVQLDVADDASVRAAAARVEEETGQLDALVNNAGAAHHGRKASEEDVDKMRATFEINVLGTIRVTQAFLPLLRKSDSGRIVMMSSRLGSIAIASDFTEPSWHMPLLGYRASKTALNMVTVKFAKELLAEGIKVNAACPGSVPTDLSSHFGDRTVEQGARSAVRLATLDWTGPTGGFFHDGEGRGVVRCDW